MGYIANTPDLSTITAALATKAVITYVDTNVYNSNSPAAAAWTDLDLSAVVGANECIVLIRAAVNGAGTIAFRKNGVTDEYYTSFNTQMGISSGQISGASKFADYLVQTDSSGIIEWECEALSAATVIDVVGYII